MTNIIKPYIPILRWRPAEMAALERLFPNDRANVTPLIEFIMPAPSIDKKSRKVIKTPKEKFLETLPNVAKGLLKSCGQSPTFIDVHLLDADIRASSLNKILSSLSELNLFSIPVIYVIPVTSTSADTETRLIAVNYARSSRHGLCIRIDKSHLSEENLSSHIIAFVETNKLDIENTDLLIDLRAIQNTNIQDIAKRLEQLPNLQKWRSFIISGGVFPKDLTEFISGKVHELDRLDWKLWNSIRDAGLSRTPLFSDYTIQCPDHERIDIIGGSVSVRYTDDTKWWIFRGKKPNLVNSKTKEKGPGFEQYIDHAKTLTGKSFSKFYKGTSYSFGDAEITRIAAPDNKKPGNRTTWLTIGINHHITLVARQISSLHGNFEAHS